MSKLKENYLVKKRNVLNEIRANSMTLQELRFLSIYLSKINPMDISTRVVKFSMEDFKTIMELGRINIDYLKNVTNSLLSKVVNVPTERGGYTGFQLFKRCKVDADNNGEWFIEIDANDDALPLMFEFKNQYFTYQLWNALSLKSSNQLRMYEILKQYENIGVRILSIEELKNLLGIDKHEYALYNNFKKCVLDACKKALSDYTDITFTYESYGKKGPGGKINALCFTISKNENYTDKLSLDKFITQLKYKPILEHIDEENESRYANLGQLKDKFELLGDVSCKGEFTIEQLQSIYDTLLDTLPNNIIHDDVKLCDYLCHKYNELNRLASQTDIKYRYNYLIKLLKESVYEG